MVHQGENCPPPQGRVRGVARTIKTDNVPKLNVQTVHGHVISSDHTT